MNKEEIKGIIREAVKEFSKRDKNSLVDVKVHESAINHRIAVYMEGKFRDYAVDCEYNKIGKKSKTNQKGV